MLTAAAWRIPPREKNKITYKLQVNNIARGDKKVLKESLKGWKKTADGWNPKQKTELHIYEKSFDTYYGFAKWKKGLPFEVEVEKDARGRRSKD